MTPQFYVHWIIKAGPIKLGWIFTWRNKQKDQFTAELCIHTSLVWLWCNASPLSSAGTTLSRCWGHCLPVWAVSVSKWPSHPTPEPCEASTGIHGDTSEELRHRCWQRTRARRGEAAGSDEDSRRPEPGQTGQVWAVWRWTRCTETEEIRGGTLLPHPRILSKRDKMQHENTLKM